MRILLTGALLLAFCLTAACSGDDDGAASPAGTPSTASSPAAAPTSTPPPLASSPRPTTAPPAGIALSDLSLVHVDRSKGQGAEIFVASFDGASPRKVTTLTGAARVLDAAGRTIAVAPGEGGVVFLDLTTGTTRQVQATGVRDGRFLDANTFLYTTGSGCGPGGSRSALFRVTVANLQRSEVAGFESPNLGIAGLDAASNTVALIPRGCDVGVSQIMLYNLANASAFQTITVEGCGWVAASIPQKKVLVSWKACTPPAAHAGADATLYDLAATPVRSVDVKAPGLGANNQAFVFRPGLPEFALGVTAAGPGGGARGGGIWLGSTAAAGFLGLYLVDGAEQYPIAWTPDGRYLLVANVQAQGLCTHAIVDATTKEIRPIAAVQVCGANGSVLGWTSLR